MSPARQLRSILTWFFLKGQNRKPNPKSRPKSRRKFLNYAAFISVVILIIISPIVYVALRHPNQTQAAWYNSTWDYRQIVTITNNGSSQTNYVVEVTADTKTLIDTGKLQSDCDDIRFTASDGATEIDFFTDYCSNTANVNSSFFVEVPSIAASGTTLIYMYYGNGSAATDSSYSSIGSVTPSGVWVGTGKDGAISVTADTN